MQASSSCRLKSNLVRGLTLRVQSVVGIISRDLMVEALQKYEGLKVVVILMLRPLRVVSSCVQPGIWIEESTDYCGSKTRFVLKVMHTLKEIGAEGS